MEGKPIYTPPFRLRLPAAATRQRQTIADAAIASLSSSAADDEI